MVIPSDLQAGLFTWDWTVYRQNLSLLSLTLSFSLSLHYSKSQSLISGLESCIMRVKPLHSALQIKVVITDLDRFSFCMKVPAEGGGRSSQQLRPLVVSISWLTAHWRHWCPLPEVSQAPIGRGFFRGAKRAFLPQRWREKRILSSESRCFVLWLHGLCWC